MVIRSVGTARQVDLKTPAGGWSDIVVICAANFWHGVKYQDRHMAEQLARSRRVLYVDPPMSRLTPRRIPHLGPALDEPRLRLVSPSIARLTPVVLPGPLRPGITRVTERLMRRHIGRAVSTLGGDVAALIATAPLLDLFGCCNERLRVYWAQDDLVGAAELIGLDAGRIMRGETQRVSGADLLVAANPSVAEGWRGRGFQPHLIPFGCDDQMFADVDNAPLPSDVDLDPPIVGFVGYIGSRIDFSLLEAIAARGRSLLLVGRRHWKFDVARMDRLLALPNVQWVGHKPTEELPSYQRMIDVGIVPYADTPFNRGSFPLKTLEYLSAGRAVVSTDLPATRWLATDLIALCAGGPEEFADAVDAALQVGERPDLVQRRRDFAAAHSWRVRADEFARVLDAGLTAAAPQRVC